MSFKGHLLYFGLCAWMATSTPTAFSQTEHPQTWAQDLVLLKKLSTAKAAAGQSILDQIRDQVERWIAAHPGTALRIADAPAQPLTANSAAAEIKELNRVITAIVARDPDHPFHLGAVTVNVTAPAEAISPMSDTIGQREIARYNEYNAALAMENLPGVSIEHMYSGRNQEMVSVHGFNYLQVPLYVDGILMNDPYDGTLDFRQIPTGDIAEIQVAKGFSSPLLGPDAVGGAINIVTKEPQKKYEGEMMTGGYTGDGFLSSLLLGSRMKEYFVEGSLDWQQAEYVPLSGGFATNALQPTDQLNNSNSHNAKYAGRIGWTPEGKGEYVFSYLNQKARDNMPLATGNDPLLQTGCGAGATAKTCYFKSSYRTWSYWDKTSYYFHSDTPMGKDNSLKTRVFYDEYPNLMYFYYGLPYTPANLNSSFVTLYDDHADGFSTELDSMAVRRNAIGASFYFKDDTHREVPMNSDFTFGPGSAVDRQQVSSIGLQDMITFKPQLIATAGMSFDHLDGLQATDTGNNNLPFTCPTDPTNTSYAGCTPHVWGYNPQASLSYSFKDSGRLFVGFARKSRFPSLKEMYSYRMGIGLPNPGLATEHSNNWQIGYSRPFAARTVAQLEFFRSDLKDAIESIPVPVSLLPANGSCGTSAYTCIMGENASHEVHEGIELTVRSTLAQRLTFDANYTYVDKVIDGFAFAGQQVYDYPCGGGYLVEGSGSNTQETAIANNTCLTATDLPKHKAVAMATLHLPLQAELNSTLRYEGGNKAVDDFSVGPRNNATYYYETFPMSNFATWDLGGRIPVYKSASFQAGIKNILDRNYYQVLDYSEEGRNWFVNMRYRF
jgi:iron complex outermembrane receptor protein